MLYLSCLTRRVFQEVLSILETEELIESFKQLVEKGGGSSIIYSYNGSKSVAAAKCLNTMQDKDKYHEFLSDRIITWQCESNTMEGHFEHVIGLFKSAFTTLLVNDPNPGGKSF